MIAEVFDQCSADIHGPPPRHSATGLVVGGPTFVEGGGVRPAVRAIEEHHLPGVTIGFQKRLEMILRASRFGEHHRFARGTERCQFFEADFQRLEQGAGFGVGADGARPFGEPFQNGDFVGQFLVVASDRRRVVERLLRQQVVEQIGFEFVGCDHRLGKLEIDVDGGWAFWFVRFVAFILDGLGRPSSALVAQLLEADCQRI